MANVLRRFSDSYRWREIMRPDIPVYPVAYLQIRLFARIGLVNVFIVLIKSLVTQGRGDTIVSG
jgi:hypothetical protein